MDNFTCEKCRMSTIGQDGVCINCGWDKYLVDYDKERESENEDEDDVESLEELMEDEYEDEDC